jgi:hypothetical protein
MKKTMRAIILIASLALVFGFISRNDPAPRIYRVQSPEIDECSGMASSRLNRDLLYTVNDSGGQSIVYALDTQGNLRHRIALRGTQNRDWEGLAIGPGPRSNTSYIYVGEIGDNSARYGEIYVYRFAEPNLSQADSLVSVDTVDTLSIVFEDGPRDAEALMVDPKTRDIVIISKREASVGVYLIPYPQSTQSVNTARKVATLPLSWVTSCDISPNGRTILVKTYTNVYKFKRGRNQSLSQAFGGKLKALPYELEPQGEAICFSSSGRGRYTLSERAQGKDLHLYFYRRN